VSGPDLGGRAAANVDSSAARQPGRRLHARQSRHSLRCVCGCSNGHLLADEGDRPWPPCNISAHGYKPRSAA
jgi:hypothetical protein